MKKFDKLQNFTQYILYKRARGGSFWWKKEKVGMESGFYAESSSELQTVCSAGVAA